MAKLLFSLLATVNAEFGDQLTAGTFAQKGLPQSMQEAVLSGEWEEVGSGECHHQFGHRFQRKGVLIPTMMFDDKGHVAGIQYPVNTETFPLYPDSNLKAYEWAQPTDLPPQFGDYALTTFFMDPDRICDSFGSFMDGKFGDRLWVATSTGEIKTNSGSYEEIPLHQEDGPLAGYINSGCAASGAFFPGSPGMGEHLWRMTQDTPCNEAGPMFLLYSRGRLVAMGSTFVGFDNRVATVNSVRPIEVGGGRLAAPGDEMLEWPRQDLSPFFFKRHDNPTCLKNLNQYDDSLEGGTVTVGTLHVFFSDPYDITCPDSVHV